MIQSLNTAATGMVAQQYNLDTISNNLANVNTTAFKLQRAEFEDLNYQTFKSSGAESGTAKSPTAVQIGLGANYASSISCFTQGSLQSTGNTLDMAINGEGFFKVLHGTQEAYTRDGALTANAEGDVVTTSGDKLDHRRGRNHHRRSTEHN
jgi:flagellar basal-body rod protein FlgG